MSSKGVSPSQWAKELTQKVDYVTASVLDQSAEKATDTYVVDEAQASCAGKVEAALPVTPEKSSDDGGENEAHPDDEPDVPPVLPSDDRVLAEVANVGNTGLVAGLEDHPANVGEPETLVGIVRVEGRVGVAVVRAVAARPPLD